jgi:hypothetical protein
MTDVLKPPRYQTYLLRCWQERSQDPEPTTVWRFSLEDPHTGRRRGFADLAALMASLQLDLRGDGDALRFQEV